MSVSFTSTLSTPFEEPNTTEFINIYDPRCKIYYTNTTGVIIKAYEGIPENLVVNLGVWIALIVLYTLLRNIGEYGRFGLLKSDEERRLLQPKTKYKSSWSSKLFGKHAQEDTQVIQSSESDSPDTSSNREHQVEAQNSANINNDSSVQIEGNLPSSSTARALTRTMSVTSHEAYHASNYKETYFFSWIINLFKLKDKHITEKSGKDAIYYLAFQRYLIVYQLIVTILSCSILLPINLNGGALLNAKIFASTTIVNVIPTSGVLWVHLVLSWLYLVLGILFMRQFSKRMQYSESDYVSRTLLITNFPILWCKTDLIYKHFQEAYPDLVVTDVQFAYDTNRLNKLEKRRRAMHIGKITSEKIYEKTNQRPTMHPWHCGSFVELCCCCLKKYYKDNANHLTDSIDYYTKNENDIKVRMSEYREKVLKKPLNIVFVTFQDQQMADSFLKDYRLGLCGKLMHATCASKQRCQTCYLCRDKPKESNLSDTLESDQWDVKYAPAPNNIKWENISKIGAIWWMRCVLINLVLIILMIFFTTPSILIEKIMPWGAVINISSLEKALPSYLAEFLPSIILRLLAALLPVAVAYTALAEMHWTRSAENRSMMVKTFTLLIFMVLILPTLGLTSINALIESLGHQDDDNIKWRCISDNGAFFLKYVTTCSFIGTALDLLRLPDLFLYILRTLWSRSSAERLAVRMQAAFEFDYGVQYAWILTIFTITTCFSVVCPLITPFGLVYLILKHIVDRYNIYFAYISTKVDKNIHKTAVMFAITSFILLQICILFFIAIRSKDTINTSAMSAIQIMIIIVSLIIYIGRIFFGLFKHFSPFKHDKKSPDIDYEDRINDLTTSSNNGRNENSKIGRASCRERV